MRCPSCKTENAATRRFCAQCGIALTSRCTSCSFENEPSAKFCGGCGRLIEQIIAPTPATITAPFRADGAERRQLTIMFCDLVGSTALSARLDPEDLRDIIGAYNAALAEIVGKFDGFVARYMGDGALVYFGYPRAHEDDAERAVSAGLALMERIGELDLSVGKLEIRIGLATGLVVVGDLIGTGDTQERNVIGETPNLAARLQNLAAPNTILIADNTRRLLGDLFECLSLGAVEVKGLTELVQIWRVIRPRAFKGRFEALRGTSLTAFIGREDEMEVLRRCWHRAEEGEGQIVLLSGEPGIGKSRIAAALQDELRNEPHTRLTYFCSPHHLDSPLYPFTAQLEQAAGFAREDPPEAKLDKLEALLLQSNANLPHAPALIADLLAIPSNSRYPLLPSDPRRRRELIFETLIARLQGIARCRPVLLIFEDAQWIDSSSLELLEMAVQRAPTLSMLCLITFRPEFQPPWTGQANVRTLTLNRFNRRDTVALAKGVAGTQPLQSEILDEIIERGDGIPLFIEEITKALLESYFLRKWDGRYILDHPLPPRAIPSSLHDSLMARLDRLAPAKEVAQIGAAIGREFTYELLAAVAHYSDEQLRDALNKLVDAGLVYRRGALPQASFIFKHALIQDAAYSTLLRSQRQKLHMRIGKLLEEQFPEMSRTQPEIIAYHYTEGGLVDLAIDYWGRAGELALKRSAVVEARKHLRRGIELLFRLPSGLERNHKELKLSLALGQATWAAGGDAKETVQIFNRARDLSEQSGIVAEQIPVLHGLWRIELQRGELIAARELAARSLTLACPHGDSEALGQANRQLGTTLLWMGMFVDAKRLLDRALQFYALRHGDTLTDSLFRAGNTLSTLGVTLWPLGYPEQAVAAASQALADARASGHMVGIGITLWCVGLLEIAFGAHPPIATYRADDAVAHCAEHLKLYEPWVRFDQAVLSSRRGSPQRAIYVMQSAMAAASELNAELGRTLRLGHLAAAHANSGKPEVGLALLDEAILHVEQTQERLFEAELHRLRGELNLKLDRTRDAQAALEQALAVARGQEARMWELRASITLSRLVAKQGRSRAAHDILEPVFHCFTEGFDTPDLKEARALLNELG
jgi:class 3 adenylate cyclase/tetratricopeptide (TPR) repeat protein